MRSWWKQFNHTLIPYIDLDNSKYHNLNNPNYNPSTKSAFYAWKTPEVLESRINKLNSLKSPAIVSNTEYLPPSIFQRFIWISIINPLNGLISKIGFLRR